MNATIPRRSSVVGSTSTTADDVSRMRASTPFSLRVSATQKPSRSGRLTSSTIALGRIATAASTADAASVLSPTTSRPRSRSMIAASVRNLASSSTIRTRAS